MQSIHSVISLILALCLFSKVTEYLENQHLWTLRLRLSTVENRLIIPSIFVIWILLAHAFLFQLPPALYPFRTSIGLTGGTCILISALVYVLPAYHSRGYLRLRWKAWGGPSRTAIRADFVPYIGDRQDWETLEKATQGRVIIHPVERFGRIHFSPHRFIVSDPTSLLQVQASEDQKNNFPWAPQSRVREGIFQPILLGRPASLLWGEHIGFQRRCSRGIISVPRYLLSPWPKLVDGVDGRGLCLATGILARNKGLHPTSLICNLRNKGTMGIFEQNSVFWPRPAKTLRSLFHRQCKHYYSDLGDAFVTAAAELALLLTDAPVEVVEDWLDAGLEHQDFELNNKAYALGAQVQELELLYRGHYSAMLVSLSAHCIGIRIRPEILVYDAVCRSVGAIPGAWTMSADMEDRRQREIEALGPRVMQLIQAIV